MKRENMRILLRMSLSVFFLVGLSVITYLIMKHFGLTEPSREDLQQILDGFGPYAPILFILISFLQVSFIRITSTITILAGNFIFGPGKGFLYSYMGIIAGSLSAFALGRWIGRRFVDWVVGSSEKVEQWLLKLKNKSNLLLLLMFILPGFPDDMLCAISGMTELNLIGFLMMQLLSRAISILATIFFFTGDSTIFLEDETTSITAAVLSALLIHAITTYRKVDSKMK